MSLYEQKQLGIVSGDVFAAAHTTPVNEVGAQVRIGSRTYRYCSTAVDLTAGQYVGQAAPSALTANALAAAAIGATELTLTIAAVTADQFAGGQIHITDDTGAGYSYLIKTNTATASGTITITLVNPLIVAVDTTSDVILTTAPYSNVIVGIAASNPLGVALVATTAGTDSTTQYFWAQTSGDGVVAVTTATSISVGKRLMGGASGGVVISDGTQRDIGTALAAVDDFVPVRIELDA